jgi:hypothetical protein
MPADQFEHRMSSPGAHQCFGFWALPGTRGHPISTPNSVVYHKVETNPADWRQDPHKIVL